MMSSWRRFWPPRQSTDALISTCRLGVDINAEDTERSRVRYGAGVTFQTIEQVAFLLDIIGSSNIADQDISAPIPVIIGSEEVGTETIARELSTDIVETYRWAGRRPWRNR
jgi:hypothetical protein